MTALVLRTARAGASVSPGLNGAASDAVHDHWTWRPGVMGSVQLGSRRTESPMDIMNSASCGWRTPTVQLERLPMSTTLYDIPLRRITGTASSLREFKGHVVLIVNVASKCGLTKQYTGLESLYERYRDQGLVIAGFPANDFAGQEPGTHEEIQSFCTLNYGVKFPLFEKIPVVGPDKHPLYRMLIAAAPVAQSTAAVPFRDKLRGYKIDPNPEPEVLWNFEKFLVDRSGAVVSRFSPDTEPDDRVLVQAIEAELKKP